MSADPFGPIYARTTAAAEGEIMLRLERLKKMTAADIRAQTPDAPLEIAELVELQLDTGEALTFATGWRPDGTAAIQLYQ